MDSISFEAKRNIAIGIGVATLAVAAGLGALAIFSHVKVTDLWNQVWSNNQRFGIRYWWHYAPSKALAASTKV